MAKVIVYLRELELDVLSTLAMREYRTTKARASMLIREELERRGLLDTGAKKWDEKHDEQ